MNEVRHAKSDTHNLVATVAYMIGVRKELLESNYGGDSHELLQSLYSSKPATIIRYLCKLRTTLFRNYKKTDIEMWQNLKNLTTLNKPLSSQSHWVTLFF